MRLPNGSCNADAVRVGCAHIAVSWQKGSARRKPNRSSHPHEAFAPHIDDARNTGTFEVPSESLLQCISSVREQRGAVVRARAVDNAWLLRAYILAAVGRRGSAIINRSKPSACACRWLATKG
jgi:hypothetical protein